MSDAVPIYPATLVDAASIAEIYAYYVEQGTATFETDPPAASEIAERVRKALDGGFPCLVARGSDRSVIGYAYAAPFHALAGYRYSCEISIYVRNGFQRRGVGTALIDALVAECEARGFRQAFAMIAGTEPGSVVLHARAGFRPCGTLENVGRKHGKWIDVFYMQRKLGEGGDTPPQQER